MDDILNNLIKWADNSNLNFKHAAAILTSNMKIAYAYGYNYKKYNMNTSIHAEMSAIRNFKQRFPNQIPKYVLVIRVKNFKDNETIKLRNSQPCANCMDKMKRFNVEVVYYTDIDGSIKNVKIS